MNLVLLSVLTTVELLVDQMYLVKDVLTLTLLTMMLKQPFKQKTAYEIGVRLVGSEMCIRDRWYAP